MVKLQIRRITDSKCIKCISLRQIKRRFLSKFPPSKYKHFLKKMRGKGLLAPQNTFLDTIATRFDGTRKLYIMLLSFILAFDKIFRNINEYQVKQKIIYMITQILDVKNFILIFTYLVNIEATSKLLMHSNFDPLFCFHYSCYVKLCNNVFVEKVLPYVFIPVLVCTEFIIKNNFFVENVHYDEKLPILKYNFVAEWLYTYVASKFILHVP